MFGARCLVKEIAIRACSSAGGISSNRRVVKRMSGVKSSAFLGRVQALRQPAALELFSVETRVLPQTERPRRLAATGCGAQIVGNEGKHYGRGYCASNSFTTRSAP